MNTVGSSLAVIHSATYNESLQLLEVSLTNGSIIAFVGIPADEAGCLLQSTEPETYLDRHIVGKYSQLAPTWKSLLAVTRLKLGSHHG